jgi:hypothetical protein
MLASRALMHLEAQSSSLASRIGGPPDLEPLKGFLHTQRGPKVGASLRALGEGGWWTQKRMFEAGMRGVEDDVCKSGHDQVGSLYHRCCGCSASRQLMEASTRHQDILHMAKSAVHCQLPLFQHGVPWLAEPTRPPEMVTRWCGGVVVEDPTFTGDVFSDGSLIGGCRRGDERSGWAAVTITEQGDVIFGIYGTCPDFFPTSLRAELWALLQVLRRACPPITIWVDNAGVVDGFGRGQQWCTAACRPAADLWSLIWWKVGDLGGSGISVVKVKAHATEADVQAGHITALQKAGNDHADHFAKRGAALAEHLSSTVASREAFRMARRWYQWLAVLISNWPDDTQGQRRQRRLAGQKRRRRYEEEAEDTEVAAAEAKRVRIPPSVTTRTLAVQLGLGHSLYQSGRMLWCRICGAYAEVRLKALKDPCAGPAGTGPRSGQLSRLLKGVHPERKNERMPRPVRVTG